MDPNINDAGGGVYQITLTPPLAGFTDFISAWLVKGSPTFLLDVGPASTSDQLLHALAALGVSRLDYILLTHIHLDHAGATGHISLRFPAARIVCHPKAIPHLVDPSRLWEGTCNVLGSMALGYGPLKPVPAERLVDAQGFDGGSITAMLTPGHAAHHVSYFTAPALFVGEACGVLYRPADGKQYMRPATPPAFFMTTALQSLDALIARAPDRLVVGHFGMWPNGCALLRQHREQLLSWEQWMSARSGSYPADEAVQCCAEGLLAEDPLLASFSDFSKPVQERERYFLKNSVTGFLGWVRDERRKA